MRPLNINPPEQCYKDKLNNLAESFKNISLDFDDEEEEDDFDIDIKNFGNNLLSKSGFDELIDTQETNQPSPFNNQVMNLFSKNYPSAQHQQNTWSQSNTPMTGRSA